MAAKSWLRHVGASNVIPHNIVLMGLISYPCARRLELCSNWPQVHWESLGAREQGQNIVGYTSRTHGLWDTESSPHRGLLICIDACWPIIRTRKKGELGMGKTRRQAKGKKRRTGEERGGKGFESTVHRSGEDMAIETLDRWLYSDSASSH